MLDFSRSREGAWIEMIDIVICVGAASVAPARERGLKSISRNAVWCCQIVAPARERGLKSGRFLQRSCRCRVAPARERGLKCFLACLISTGAAVAPARERGLKSPKKSLLPINILSLPRGSVD